MWPQKTAGIAVNSRPQNNEGIARTRLQIAVGAVRRTGWMEIGCKASADVSSAIARL
jgi:hypothetical protein